MKNFTPYRLVLFEGVADAFKDSLLQGETFGKLLRRWTTSKATPVQTVDAAGKEMCETDIRKRLGELKETIANTLVDGDMTEGLANSDYDIHFSKAKSKQPGGFLSAVLAKASRYSIFRKYAISFQDTFALNFKHLLALLPEFDLYQFTDGRGKDTLLDILNGYFNIFNVSNPQLFPRKTLSYIIENCTIKVQKQLLEGMQERIRGDVETVFCPYHVRGTKCVGFDPSTMELRFNTTITGTYAVLDRSGKVINGSLSKGRDYSVDYSFRYSSDKWLLSAIKMSILLITAKPSYYC